MWQRFQTLFLGIVVIVMVASIFLPIWKYEDRSNISPSGTPITYELYPLHFSVVNGEQRTTAYFPYSVTAILMIAAATVAIQAIRRFDNRLTQMKLAAFNTLLLMGVMGSAVYFAYKLNAEYNHVGLQQVSLWTIFSGVAFNWLAMRFIRRDEKIVKDSERLR
jgi:hypothetical protein